MAKLDSFCRQNDTWCLSDWFWLFGKIEVFELGLMSLPGLNLFVVRCWRLTEDFDLNWRLDWSFLRKIDELATSLQSWFLNSGLDWTLLWHGFLKPGLPPRNKVKTRLGHLVNYSNMVSVFNTCHKVNMALVNSSSLSNRMNQIMKPEMVGLFRNRRHLGGGIF